MSCLMHQAKLLAKPVIGSSLTNLKIVRYRLTHRMKEPFRKPVWQPMAPSKLFRIKTKDKLSEAEEAQRKHLEQTYAIAIKSINGYLAQEFYQPTLGAGGRTAEEVQQEQDQQEELLKANELENSKVANQREQRLKILQTEKEAQLLAKQIALEQENQVLGEQLDEIVQREIERSKTYITKDNLDEKIEQALAHQVSYDFALDRNGAVVFDGSLHPYALTPKAVPETSDVTQEFAHHNNNKPVYLKANKLF